MKIYLYTVISSNSEEQIIQRSFLDGIKIKIHHLMNNICWKIFDKFNFQYHQYMVSNDTNSGDVAIRVSIEELLLKKYLGNKITFVEIPWGSLDNENIKLINSDGNLFIIGGSGYYHHDINGLMNQRFIEDFPLIEKINCPIVTHGVGMNRKLSSSKDTVIKFPDETVNLFQTFIKQLSLSSVRDKYSQKTLQSLVPDIETMLISDPALFLEAEDSGVNLDSEKIKIGLNFAFHGPFCESVLKQNILIYIAFLKRIIAEISPEFYYFQHSDSEQVIPDILRAKGIHVQVISLPPKKMLDVYRQLDVHICQMMHSSILSCNAGTPTFNLAYDRKNISFYELMEFTEFQLPVYDIDDSIMFEKFNKMFIERDALRNHLQNRKKLLWETENEFLVKLFACVSCKKICQ